MKSYHNRPFYQTVASIMQRVIQYEKSLASIYEHFVRRQCFAYGKHIVQIVFTTK